MSSEIERQVEFTKSFLVPKIIEGNDEFYTAKLVNVEAVAMPQLNGFMSNIILLSLRLKHPDENEKVHKIIVKFMKGTPEARDLVRAYIQSLNEIFIYKKVIPTYQQKFRDRIKTIDSNLWCARAYLAEAGHYPKLSDNQIETILAVEDLSALGFQMTKSRCELSEDEILLMTRAIAKWHSLSYTLKIQQNPIFKELTNEMITLTFGREDGISPYDILCKFAVDRLFNYFEQNPQELDEIRFKQDMKVLREKYYDNPVKLIERFRRHCPIFSTIVHGDYNRNNVMFKYDQYGKPYDLRMFDFQQLRYGSPCLDISFYLYMNANPSLWKNGIFQKVEKLYHETLIQSIAELLDCNTDDSRLGAYSFANFKKHFDQFAFYGGMVALHFLPWMICSLEECEKMSQLWYNDMLSPELRKLALTCGGINTDKRLAEIAKMASREGHLKMLYNED